jgi:dUTP pyrophosphatase
MATLKEVLNLQDQSLQTYYSKPNAKLGQPREGDAGFDLYSPEAFTLPAGKVEINLPFTASFFQKLMDATETSEMIVHTLATAGFSAIKIPTGIHVAIPSYFVGMICDRSSMGVKTVKVLGGIIDSIYRGEISVLLVNLTMQDQHFEAGSKIAQMLIIPVATPTITEVSDIDQLGKTERGDGGFGSTGK